MRKHFDDPRFNPFAGPVALYRVRLDSGGYDPCGCYFGHGAPLYRADDAEGHSTHVRAHDRLAAADHFERKFPGIRWARGPRPSGEWWSSSSGRIELHIPKALARACSHPGPCDADVADARENNYVARQLASIDKDTLAAELKEYGAWNAAELADHEANLDRILWIACGDIAEGLI